MEGHDGRGCGEGIGVLRVGKASVLPTEVHHETKLINRADSLEERNQKVLVDVAWDLTDENLTARAGSRTLPAWRRRRINGKVKMSDIIFAAKTKTKVKRIRFQKDFVMRKE